jgi:hypothetical protein
MWIVAVGFVLCLGVICCQVYETAHKQKHKVAEVNAGDAKIVCPQCQERGHVTTKKVEANAGIHGGKATAALLTGGISMLATGLSNKVEMTEAKCSNCNSKWQF